MESDNPNKDENGEFRWKSGPGWIQTFTGRAFSLLEPQPDDVTIEDIAHALSMLCRFGGHVRDFYSVAQHSVLVSIVVERFQPANRALHLAGLMHDGSEAYLIDLPRPIKRMAGFEAYKVTEQRVEWAIRERFGLSTDVPDVLAIKAADEMLLRTECRDLMGPRHPAWTRELHPDHGTTMPEIIAPLAPKEAEQLFLERWQDLLTMTEPPL